jgi:hypothetical protein
MTNGAARNSRGERTWDDQREQQILEKERHRDASLAA